MKKKLLLHSCCAPCSTIIIESLIDLYDITIFYYNPNIEPITEYNIRKNEQIRYLNELKQNIQIVIGDYENDYYHQKIANHEHLKENSQRCYECIDLRIQKTALYAKSNNYDCFDTTLSVSPHKNSNWINEIGKKYSLEYKIDYLNGNYKKNDGYKKSVELAKKHNLYRQNYCGCLVSSNNL